MTPSWTQALLQFMLWFSLASIGGCVSYSLFRLAPKVIGDIAAAWAIILTLIACLSLLTDGLMTVGIVVILASLPSVGAAFCEKAMDTESRSWGFHFGRSLLTYLFSVALSIGVFILVQYWTSPLIFVVNTAFHLGGIAAGLLLTPISISLIRWMIHHSRLRPGMDRHLEEGEEER